MGGAPCAGKSSIADLLASWYGLRVYHIDDVYAEDIGSISPEVQPCLYKWTHTHWEALWTQPLDVLLYEAISCYGEHFEFVIRDLVSLPKDEDILVEGNPIMPDLLAPFFKDRWRGIWIVPSDDFLRRTYPRRGPWVQEIVNQCQNPELCLNNWLDRDVAFAHWVRKNARNRDYEILTVGGRRTISENAVLAAAHFGLNNSSRGEI